MHVGIAYTVGVKRRFLPGYRKFSCVHHAMDHDGLELHLVDGSAVFMPTLILRGYKVYPNYSVAQEKIERLKKHSVSQSEQAPARSVSEEEAQRDFDAILAEMKARHAQQQGDVPSER
jgi:hypothetical protein